MFFFKYYVIKVMVNYIYQFSLIIFYQDISGAHTCPLGKYMTIIMCHNKHPVLKMGQTCNRSELSGWMTICPANMA